MRMFVVDGEADGKKPRSKSVERLPYIQSSSDPLIQASMTFVTISSNASQCLQTKFRTGSNVISDIPCTCELHGK